MIEFDKRIGNARIKSTVTQVRISYNGETLRLSKRKLKKFFVKAAAFLILFSALGKTTDKVVEKVGYLCDVVSVRVEESKETEELLSAYNLNTEPTKNGDWCNDYSTIEGLSEKDIYGFLQYCGYDETEKVIQTLGYDSWHNYLARKGYMGADGRPSIKVWENYAEYKLVTEKSEAKENGRRY